MKNHLPAEHHKLLIGQIEPKLRYDGSVPMEEWAIRCREKLSELLGMDTFSLCDPEFTVCYETKAAEFRRIHFTVQTEAGYHARCDLLLPGHIEGKLPLCVALQGHTSGSHISFGLARYPRDAGFIHDDECDYALQAARLGYASLCIEMRAFGACGGTVEGPVCAHAARGALLLGRTLVGERVWDVMRCIDAIEANFSDCITLKGSLIVGLSGGGTATYYTACMEPRLESVISAGAVCTYRDSIIGMLHCDCNYIPGIARWFDMGDLAAMILPKKLIVLNGREDRIFPLQGTQEVFAQIRKLYAAAGIPDDCELVLGDYGHRFYSQVWPVLGKMQKNA